MTIGQIVSRALPPVLLALISLVSWQAANRADFAPIEAEAEVYAMSAPTPMLSARRIPQSLRAPLSEDLLAPAVGSAIRKSPSSTCASIAVGDRVIAEQSTSAGGLVPASNQKLVTTYAALGILGPDYTFTTQAVAATPPVAGVLDGDLYLVGSGDPFLVTENWLAQYGSASNRSHTRLEDLADGIRDAGVTSITGSVLGDESRFDSERYGPWDARLIQQKQSGPLSALTVNESFVDWPSEFQNSFRQRSETDNPPLHAASILAQLLQERGISIEGTGVGVAPPITVTVASVQSPPLTDTVTHINSYSSNIGAELLVKEISLASGGPGTTAEGAQAITRYLTNQGVPMTDVIVNDGSGLAESDRLTCRAVTQILMESGLRSPLGDSLSIASTRGSLADRYVDTPLAGQVFGKTGSLRTVRALSGFVQSASEPEAQVVFSYIANDEAISNDEVLEVQESFVQDLSKYPLGPPITDLDPSEPVNN